MRRSVTVQKKRWPKNPSRLMQAVAYRGKGPPKPLTEAQLNETMRELQKIMTE